VKRQNLILIHRLLNSAQIFHSNGADVRYWARKINDKEYLLYLGNLERLKSANPLVGLGLPDGEYNVTVCSSLEGTRKSIAIHEGMIDRKTVVRANSLKKFHIGLRPGEIKLVRIQGM
jgi:hypothetical protein